MLFRGQCGAGGDGAALALEAGGGAVRCVVQCSELCSVVPCSVPCCVAHREGGLGWAGRCTVEVTQRYCPDI